MMHAKGHAGLTLLIFSFLMMPFGSNEVAIVVILSTTAFSSIPDILGCEWSTLRQGKEKIIQMYMENEILEIPSVVEAITEYGPGGI
ncbi:MAG: hypothetical protein J7L80_02380 [Thermoplasmata archaeon]|nr:hypothetical protein [Thermoplasmata archaeon]